MPKAVVARESASESKGIKVCMFEYERLVSVECR